MVLPNEAKIIELINTYITESNMHKNKIHLILVVNLRGITENDDDYDGTSIEAEYWAIEKFEIILNTYRNIGFEVSCFYDEKDFINYYIKNLYGNNIEKDYLVINYAQKGTSIGRKSLIPSFCDLFKLKRTGSNPYVVSLARNKYHSSCILSNNNIPTAQSYLYHYEYGWISSLKPSFNEIVIAKLNYESSSIGLSSDNIFMYSDDKVSFLKSLSIQYNQPIIVQQFISGFEIELPVLCSRSNIIPILPVGISLNDNIFLADNILDYNIRKSREYGFYNFLDIDKLISSKMMNAATKCVELFDLNGFARVDFRVDKNMNFYITDIATNPGITKETSYYFAFKNLGMTYQNMLETFIGINIQ